MRDSADLRRDAKLLFTAEQVGRALDDMAGRIDAELNEQLPVVLAIMNGGVFVATELCRRLRIPFEFDYVHATRYGHSTTGRNIEWRVPPHSGLRGRVVLVVDDVLDRGITLSALIERLEDIRVAALYTAVLARKNLRESVVRPDVDFIGLETGDLYLIGCGMDYRGLWRGLPAIYGVGPTT